MKSDEMYKLVFGEDRKREAYKMVGHSFNRTAGGKPYCTSCGLVALNNEFTRWSVKHGCLSDLHPQYQSTKKRLTWLRK